MSAAPLPSRIKRFLIRIWFIISIYAAIVVVCSRLIPRYHGLALSFILDVLETWRPSDAVALISVSVALSQTPVYTAGNGYGASASRGAPVCAPALACTHWAYPQKDGQAELTWVTTSCLHIETVYPFANGHSSNTNLHRGKPSSYITNYQGQLSLSSLWVSKSSTDLSDWG